MAPLESMTRRLRHTTLLQWQVALAGAILVLLCLQLLAGSRGSTPKDFVADVQVTEGPTSDPPEDYEPVFRIIAARELFRPPIAQETSDSTAMTVQKLLQRLALVGIIVDQGEAKAWIAVTDGDGLDASSTLVLCGPGDVVGGFTVNEVRSSSALLEISGQVVELKR
jgi:hypothetical protein